MLSSRHLLAIKDLTLDDVGQIFDAADEFKTVINRPIKKVPSLRDVTVANLFFENSTRTKLSFELAERRLSADVLNFSASGSSVSKGETLLDTVQNILAMKVDMLILRHPSPGAGHFLSQRTQSIIINAGDGAHEHPTQALLDCYSIRERLETRDLKGVRVAIVGDILHSRVALSNIFLLQLLGAEVMLCGPATLLPPHAKSLGVRTTDNLDEALAWADALNMLRIQMERQDVRHFPSLDEYQERYGLTESRLDSSASARLGGGSRHALPLILHPGPINRGVEVSAAIADGPQSLVMQQVENGVAVRMAVLYLLAQGVGR